MKPRSMTLCFFALSFFLFAPFLSAQTVYIVDAAGGPGSSFRDLPQAVSRAPSGSCLLVRPGGYKPFVVFGKALKIKGAGPGKTVIRVSSNSQVLSILNVPGGGTFVLEDLDISINSTGPAPYLSLSKGRFYLGDVRVLAPLGATIPWIQVSPHGPGEVMISDSLVLAVRLKKTGGAPAFLLRPQGVLPAGVYARRSKLQFTDCQISGPWGGKVDAQKDGGPGIVLEGSVLDLFGGKVLGGSGGNGTMSPGFKPGSGAPGIELRKGSLVLGEGCLVRGGGNGCYMAGLSGWVIGGVPGVGVLLDSTSAARFHGSDVKGGCYLPMCGTRNSAWSGPGTFKSRPGPVHRPRLTVTHNGPAGKGNRIEVTGVPGRLHVLLAGKKPAWIPLGPLGFPGTLQVDPGTFWVLPFRLSPKGTWGLDLPGISGPALPAPFQLQAFMAPEGDQVVSSNAVPLILWP